MGVQSLSYYPLFLNLTGRVCLVVGGGRVADRKVKALIACGARVRVVSPRVCKSIRVLYDEERIELIERTYETDDLKGAALVFAATNDAATNERVSQDARERGILVNVADSPDLCDFIVPAVVRRDPIVIAISTSGTLPMLARRLREEIGRQLSKDHTRYTMKVGKLRELLMERVGDRKKRERILAELSKMDISEIAAMSMKELRDRFLKANPKS